MDLDFSLIDNNRKFHYIIAIFISIAFIYRINPQPWLITGIICGIIVVYIWHVSELTMGNNFIAEIKGILQSDTLQHATALYTDSKLIKFLDNYKEYYTYNPASYKALVIKINDFLVLTSDFEEKPSFYELDFTTLSAKKLEIMNMYQSFGLVKPKSPPTDDKHQSGSQVLQDLLNYHIDRLHRNVALWGKEKGVNTNSIFPHRNHPQPRDTNVDTHYDFY